MEILVIKFIVAKIKYMQNGKQKNSFNKERSMKKFIYWSLFSFLSISGINSEIVATELPIYYPQEEHIAEYLKTMPWNLYKSYHVPGLAWFWVDNAKDCVKDTIKSGKIWEPYIINVLKKYIKEGDNVIDVGAHMGTISLAMSNLVGKTGMVHSFEAEIQLFRELYHNIYSNGRTNIIPYLVWLGNKNEEIECAKSCHPYNINYSPVSRQTIAPWIRHHRTLDSFGFKNIDLMKVDIECTENEFLEGAQETIMSSRPILIIEIMGGYGLTNTPEVKNKIQSTIQLLEKMDYQVSKIWIDDYLAIPK